MENEEVTFKEVIHLEGVGTVRGIGKLDVEGLIKALLECKYITG